MFESPLILTLLLGMPTLAQIEGLSAQSDAQARDAQAKLCKKYDREGSTELEAALTAWRDANADLIKSGAAFVKSAPMFKEALDETVGSATAKLTRRDDAGRQASCRALAQRMRMEVENRQLIRKSAALTSAAAPHDRAMLLKLLAKDPAVRLEAVAAVKAAPGKYAPPVLEELAEEVFAGGAKEEAAFWYYAAALRARIDRARIEKQRRHAWVLNVPWISEAPKHVNADPKLLAATTERVLGWDAATPRESEPAWMFELDDAPDLRTDTVTAAELGRAAFAFDMAARVQQLSKSTLWTGPHKYALEDGKVYYEFRGGVKQSDTELPGVDAKSFVAVGSSYGRDQTRAYWREFPLTGANPATLRQLSWYAATDGRSVWFRAARCADCDGASIRSVYKDDPYSEDFVDRTALYHAGETAVLRWPVEDGNAVVAIGSEYIKDATHVWFDGKEIEGADAPTFEMQVCGKSDYFAKDKDRYYFFGKPTSGPCANR